MTVKIGTGGSALDLKDAKVWGYQATKIMVGTGTTAIEVWPPYRESNRTLTYSGTIQAPDWARIVRVVIISGGGGGGGGNGGNFASGEGGNAGAWRSTTIPLEGRSISVTVGSGGNGGNLNQNGSAGGTTAVTNGSYAVTAPGGSGGRGGAPNTGVAGKSPGGYIPFGNLPAFQGGARVDQDQDGSPPGGGGGGGGGGIFGGGSGGRPGGRGQVWLYYYSHDPRL